MNGWNIAWGVLEFWATPGFLLLIFGIAWGLSSQRSAATGSPPGPHLYFYGATFLLVLAFMSTDCEGLLGCLANERPWRVFLEVLPAIVLGVFFGLRSFEADCKAQEARELEEEEDEEDA